MIRISQLKALSLVALSLALSADAAANNLLTNGGFEDGLNGWTFTGDGTNDTATLSSDTPTGFGQSADLDINQGNGLPWLQQDVPVNVGDALTFMASVREVKPNSPDDAWIAGQVWMLTPDLGSILSSVALFYTNSEWETQSAQITAPPGAAVARVLFTPQNTAFGVGTGQYRIDNVSLIIPEPATAFTLLVGSAIVFSIRWQRRR